MSIVLSCLVFSCMALAFFPAKAVSGSHEHSRGVIGVILDNTSRAGREAKVSIKMALDDIGNNTNQSFVSHIINSQGKPLLAALAARNLIGRKKVQAILGPHTWKETSLVAEVANKRSVPTLSLAGSTPKWATETWPFLVQASVSSQDAQMKAVAAIVQSYDWHRVTLIYEEGIDSASDRVIPNLFEALREARADISHLVPLQLSPSVSEELKRLKEDQCKVFVVHTSLILATHLFENAKALQMMEKGYVWITTNTITDLVHSLDVSAIFSMQGTLGIKTHFSTTGSGFVNFKTRFREKFSLEYPEEENNEPGIYAVEAYDAVSVVALALDQGNMQIHGQAQHFIEKIPSIDFNGLTGRVFFTKRNLVPSRIFGVVNVIEKKSRELGFWSEGLGFSKSISEKAIYNYSMQNLGEVNWPGEPRPGEPRYTPKGWTVPTSINNSLRIGVPANAMFKQFVNTSYNPLTRNYSCIGYAIKIFNETMARLPYVPYHFVPFNGTYESLAEQIYLNEFDAVVHVGVTASRCKFADFTHTYTESALTMIVSVQSKMPHKAWLFMKPFTKVMWALICAITIYNGFVIWLIERHHNARLRGSAVDQTGIMISSSFTTLFSLHGGRLHSNLSRLTMVVWIFVALVITQSYTASLSSMLTVRKLEPTVADTETLRNNNATVGYWTGGFAATYLEEVLGFKACNIQNFSSPLEFAEALKTGQITAGFINGAYVELFLARYCKSLIVAGPSYKIGGFGFAFPRGSPMLADVNEAVLNVLESKKLRELEDSMIGSEKCVEMDSTGDEEVSLSLDSFWILFVFTGSTTTCALLIYYQCKLRIVWNFMVQTSRNILSVMLKNWEYQPTRISTKVYNSESL